MSFLRIEYTISRRKNPDKTLYFARRHTCPVFSIKMEGTMEGFVYLFPRPALPGGGLR